MTTARYPSSSRFGILERTWIARGEERKCRFNQATAHAAFLGYGLATGAVIFLWSLAVLVLARLFRRA